MNIDAIRALYAYNDALHRQLWDCIDHLTGAQFIQPVEYSIGAVRNHMIHLASVDQRWIARVVGDDLPDRLRYEDYATKAAARDQWELAQAFVMEAVNHRITEADLPRVVEYGMHRTQPPGKPFAAHSAVWEILVHVVNHGTDHRAQVLRLLHDFGAPTLEQDAMIYWWERDQAV